ncbi:helix-turn-helix domain-containing protein [Anaerotignum sp. MB30-C6]|uniref:helix-turn-helix domain-containing protein n=1 Tax=Anaerotignum sp. MB30-C6 TaxID=3070814 RepID=UPI0027DABE15|nr:helix-turn-helix transcriptional regulator [Anaerotignum sp. MB30-C6]WMI82450.1 helix-turn-helix transcriptional regulator [Anaerotignum sp. MB30-C6]
MKLHEVIKAIRLEMGLPQQALARELHVCFAMVNRWENQRSKPTKIAIHALAELAMSRKVAKELIKQLKELEFQDK